MTTLKVMIPWALALILLGVSMVLFVAYGLN